MNSTKTDRRRKNLAAIHIYKKALGLTDTGYRRVLNSLVGKYSAKGMTAPELYKVRQFLKREKSSRAYVVARGKHEWVSDAEARAILG
jgi:phage gp16-like protein